MNAHHGVFSSTTATGNSSQQMADIVNEWLSHKTLVVKDTVLAMYTPEIANNNDAYGTLMGNLMLKVTRDGSKPLLDNSLNRYKLYSLQSSGSMQLVFGELTNTSSLNAYTHPNSPDDLWFFFDEHGSKPDHTAAGLSLETGTYRIALPATSGGESLYVIKSYWRDDAVQEDRITIKPGETAYYHIRVSDGDVGLSQDPNYFQFIGAEVGASSATASNAFVISMEQIRKAIVAAGVYSLTSPHGSINFARVTGKFLLKRKDGVFGTIRMIGSGLFEENDAVSRAVGSGESRLAKITLKGSGQLNGTLTGSAVVKVKGTKFKKPLTFKIDWQAEGN